MSNELSKGVAVTNLKEVQLSQFVRQRGDKRIAVRGLAAEGGDTEARRVVLVIEQATNPSDPNSPWVAHDKCSLKAADLDSLLLNLSGARKWFGGSSKKSQLTLDRQQFKAGAIGAILTLACVLGFQTFTTAADSPKVVRNHNALRVTDADPMKKNGLHADKNGVCITKQDGSLECNYK